MNEWVAIEKFERPDTLAEAAKLWQDPGAEYFSGGSRLAAHRPAGVTSLISISHLIGGKVNVSEDTLTIPAGSSLQDLIDALKNTTAESLATATQASCSSRNLRNQRTLGGELTDGCFDSDLKIALSALNPTLTVFDDQDESISYSDWNGNGIIQQIQIPIVQLKSLRTERFSLLPASPAFLILASCQSNNGYQIAVGGAMDQIVVATSETSLDSFIDTAAAGFKQDHFGSQEYKKQLLIIALKRLGVVR
jgi:CO/xanthine dehydrogenase FAD-binding subunit